MTKLNHFLSITDLSSQQIWDIFHTAKKLKTELKVKGKNKLVLGQKTLVMIFEKPSLRTRVSFEAGMTQLGGHAIYLAPSDIGLGTRESIADVAKVISGMGDLLMARTFKHQTIVELAKYSNVPVINGLSDMEHPCQALADLFTIWEIKGSLAGLTLSYVGDGENNVPHALVLICGLLGVNFRCAAPEGFLMKREIVEKAKILSLNSMKIFETNDPKKAVLGADIVYTDTWVSMGDEAEEGERLAIFEPYQVNSKLMALAKKDAIFMHDLPAYRGNEVTQEVVDGKQSVVFQQAENRLHVQKALMVHLKL